MKDKPEIVDPAGWAEIFCAALASEQHRAAPGRSLNPGLHLRRFDDFSPGVVSGPTRLPAFHSQNAGRIFTAGADRHSDSRRRLRH